MVRSAIIRVMKSPTALQRLTDRSTLVNLGCALMVAAVGATGLNTWLEMPERFADVSGWLPQWVGGITLFAAASLTAGGLKRPGATRVAIAALAMEAAAALYLIHLYPAFLVTSVVVVVAWQIAWRFALKTTLLATSAMAVALVVMKCIEQSDGVSVVILLAACAFQVFAVAAAHLARSEAEARMELALANTELKTAQILLTESTRMSERVRISRDLHDVLGHSLTTMTIHLDVATRLAEGESAKHLRTAREVSETLLDQVRMTVAAARVLPMDLRHALQALTEIDTGMTIRLNLPDDLPLQDPLRGDAILRCAQEVITNALRHAGATQLTISLDLEEDGSLTVAAADDGVGGSIREGLGLKGMRERFEALGGHLQIRSDARGFHLAGAIPAVRSFA